MRVALYSETFAPHVDGLVTRLTHTLTWLNRFGDEVLVIAPSLDGLPGEFAGARVIGAPSMVIPMYRDLKFGFPLLFPRIRAAIDAFAPDVIHAVNPFLTSVGGVRYAQRAGKPLVASFHTQVAEYVSRYHLGLLRQPLWRHVIRLHNQADLNLCTSHPMQAVLRVRGIHEVALWAPGVDAEQFTPTQRSREWRARLSAGDPDATILLYVGRLAPEKSLERLLPVLHRLPNVHLALVGAGPEASSLRRIYAGAPVTFVGSLSGQELAAAYASADIFALPSSTETLGLAAIEAMASGLPVIGANRGGIPDIVRDGETGLLFDPDQPETLIYAAATLVDAPARRRLMGDAALERAQLWSWEESTRGLRAYYEQAIERRGRLADSLAGSASAV
ncbi:MAG TPA: glycosyltransferase family 1 protein [Ktedonobacterales bacterium]